MSKSKRTNQEIIYELKRQLKEKDEIIRKLQRKVTDNLKEDKKEQKEILPESKKKRGNCPECEDGKLTTTDLNVRIIEFCDSCKYRKVSKK